MRSAARQIARLVPVPRSVKPRLLDISECPHCGSRHLQTVAAEARGNGKVALALHCPDCLSRMRGTFSDDRVRELDRSQASARAELRAAYERTVRENMARELGALGQALELDLIDADDFRPRRGRRSLRPRRALATAPRRDPTAR